MNKRLISLMAAALALLSAIGGPVEFTGCTDHDPIEITLSDNQTSLNKIYVLFDTDGVGMTYTATTSEPVTWETYDANTWANHQPITNIRHYGSKTTLDQVIPNKGYVITEGTTPFYCWVVNYADYYLILNGISFNSEASCNLVSFNIDGQADGIPYYEINGHRQVLDREIKLTYHTLMWDENDSTCTAWQDETLVETFAALDQGVEVIPPLCDTKFTLSGDRFLEEWGLVKKVETDIYHTQSVSCYSKAVQELRGNENEENLNSGLGGSAPVHIVFTGYPTDAAVYHMWEMATDQDFENIILQDSRNELDYTFYDAGTYYLRYRVANADGTCEYYSETYSVKVSESKLECTNVFIPRVHKMWQVSYKSIVEFHCWIFNRWGSLVYEFTDPGGGWDGTYRGQDVDTGVYYYVIKAVGSDGEIRDRRGDITVLRHKYSGGGTMTNGQGGGVDSGGN